VGFRDDIQFLIGALNHGMTAEQALPMYQAALQNKQANKQARRDALTNLLTTGQELSQTVDDPQTFSKLMSMYGKGYGARPGQVAKVSEALGADVDDWTDQDTTALIQTHGETVRNWLAANQTMTPQEARYRLRRLVQEEAGITPEEWQAKGIGPKFDKAFDAVWVGAGGAIGKGSGYPSFLEHAALRAKHAVASPQETEQRGGGAQPPPAAEGAGVPADSSSWTEKGLGVGAGVGALAGVKGAAGLYGARNLAKGIEVPKIGNVGPGTFGHTGDDIAGGLFKAAGKAGPLARIGNLGLKALPLAGTLAATKDFANYQENWLASRAQDAPLAPTGMVAGGQAGPTHEAVTDLNHLRNRILSWFNPFG
jgi:hypothetical protein